MSEPTRPTWRVESDHEGVVTEVSVGPGDVIDVGAPLFVLETVGEDLLAGMFDQAPEVPETVNEEPTPAEEAVAPKSEVAGSQVLAMPGARKLAAEAGIDLSQVSPASAAGIIKQRRHTPLRVVGPPRQENKSPRS